MAKKKTEARIIINLACTECKERTYTSTKNRRNDTQRMELKKYCPRCRTHQLHREVR
ncbi:MAG: 50S ribosomal protein L33 [Dehalococcoidales bacterium]|jgi:large subunit ribosomal protein L33|nr:50S ribosomal protein L33 [Dehalococcoidales bacterium]